MTNSADPDQLASEEAKGSGSTLFAKISLLLKKPTDLDIHYLQRRTYSGSAAPGLNTQAYLSEYLG